jgi:competence protein ComEC
VTVGAWLDARAGRWRRVTSVFTPTLGAQVVALPILLWRFHAVSWVAPLANLVAVPISGLLLAAAWIGALLEFAWPGAGRWCLDACAPLALAFRLSATLAARVPGALSACGSEVSMAVLAAVGAALLAWALASRRALVESEGRTPPHRRLAAMAGAWCCALAMLLAWSARPLSPGPGRTWVVVLDVGQGDCIAIAHRGAWWLVDAGPRSDRFDAGESVVLPFLRWAGVRRLEGVAVTHDDNDHRGGVPALRRDVAIARLWAAVPRPGAPGPAARFGAVTVARGDTLAQDPLLRVLWPPREGAPLDDALSSAGNQASLVLELGESAGRALLLADADSLVEAALVVVPGVAVVKAGHHGSSSSSGGVFAHRLSPRVAVFASGRRNPFGHPDPGALDRMRAAGARIDRTDRSGACWYELDAAGWRDVDWRHERPGALRASIARARAGLPRAPRRE